MSSETVGPACHSRAHAHRHHRTILDLERTRWKYAGAKEAAVRDQLGISYTRYCQIVLALLDNPHAEAADPTLIRRLRRLRDARRAARSPQTPNRPASTWETGRR